METWQDALPELRTKYLRLASDRLRGIESALRLLESHGADAEALRDLEHFFHGFAGSGSTYGYPEVSTLARRGEETAALRLRETAPAAPPDLQAWRDILDGLRKELFPSGEEPREAAGASALLSHVLTPSAFLDRAKTVLSDKRRKREASPVLAMLVIDSLRAINERYGHAAGDQVLGSLAQLLARRLRSSDAIGRYRGDEFGIILIDLPEEEARQLLTQLLHEFTAIEQTSADGRSFEATFSAGVASLDRERMSVEQWVRAADSALDAARAIGPNRILAASTLDPLPASAAAMAAEAPPKASGVPGSRVLFVDDDETVVEAYCGFLRAGGFEVVSAGSGREALERLETYEPEIIIADVRMPEMDGYEFCRQVRRSGRDAIPFLFCSRLGTLPERITGLRMGADDYMVKPVVPEELILKTRRLIEKGRQLDGLKRMFRERSRADLMDGKLGEIALPELLQIFDLHARGDVLLRLDGPGGETGEIHLLRRKVVHAALGPLAGEKALFRMFDWSEGVFHAERKSYRGKPTLDVSLQECLLKAAAQHDEFRLMRKNLATQGEALVVRHSPALDTSQLEEATKTVLALVEQHHEIDRILDASPLTDLITLRIILQLLHVGVLGFPGPHLMADWWVIEKED